MKKVIACIFAAFSVAIGLAAEDLEPGRHDVVIVGEQNKPTPYEVVMVTFWYDTPTSSNINYTYGVKGGAPFGVGAPVYGLEASVIGSLTDFVDGVQTSLIVTKGKEVNGLQFSIVNLVDKLCGLQLGVLNIADDATVQIGILNFNKNGILPVLPVINFNF